MFPHDHIRKTQDRSWTSSLIDALKTVNTEEITEIVASLTALEDPHSVAPLTALLLNIDNPSIVRQAASDALYAQNTAETHDERIKWWHTGDEIIKRYSLSKFERTELDLIETLLSDPSSIYYADAIAALENTQCEEVRYQRVLIKALNHEVAEVRLNAASALIWHEPVAAEDLLIEVSTYDSDIHVAQKAIDTLAYFTTRNVLTRMHELRKTGRAELKNCYDNTFKWVNEDFDYDGGLTGEAAKLFSAWLDPVKDILEHPEKQSCNSASTQSNIRSHTSEKLVPSMQRIMREFGEPGGEWLDKKLLLFRFDWKKAGADDRSAIAEYLSSHPDATVRERANEPCALWGDIERLLALSNDRILSVRKSAAYNMRLLPQSQEIANRLWQMFTDPCTTYVFCDEALESYVVHESSRSLDDILLSVAQNDKRPTAVTKAIYQLQLREASEHIKKLGPLLQCPPMNNWAVHIALLDSCRELGIATGNISHLAEVDNLHLQVSLCQTLAC